MNVFSFRVLPFKVHQLLVSMVSLRVPMLSFHHSARERERESEKGGVGGSEQGRERERENDRRLLAVVISPLHKVPFALPSA